MIGRLRRIDATDERTLQSQEDAANFPKLIELLKGVRGIAPRANALNSRHRIKVQQQDEIGSRSKTLIFNKDGVRIGAAGPLVSRGGKVITVKEHDPAGLERWTDNGLNVFSTVF